MPALFSSPSPPQPIDPGFVIGQQSKANVNAANNSAFLNNVNQRTPYGNLTYNLLPGVVDYDGNWVPRFEAVTEFTPEQKALYDKQIQVTQGAYNLAGDYMDRVRAATATPFTTAGAPDAPGVPQYNDAFHDEVFNKILERNRPQQERDRLALETRLANQGISLGTDAYRSGMDDYNRGINDFRLAADIDAGNQAVNRFNANAASFGMGTDARKNYLTEQQMLRMQPIQEISALMGTGGGQQYPSFVPTNNYQIQPTDVGGIYGMAAAQQQANYQAQRQAQNAGMGGLFGLAGTLGGAAIGGPLGGMLGGALGRGAGSGWTY